MVDVLIQIGYLITIFLLNKIIFLFYLYFLILLYQIKKLKTTRYIEEEKKKKEAVEKLMNENENIKNQIEIKNLNIQNYRLKSISQKIDLFNHTNFKRGEVNRFFLFLTNNTQNVFRLLLTSLAIYLIIQNKLSISSTLIVINYETEIFFLLDSIETLQKNKKIFDLASKRIKEKCHIIESQNVSLAYQKDQPVLKNINFQIHANEHIGFVGTSGSGKSTIFHLLCQHYKPLEGSILLNHQSIEEYKEKDFRNQITIVSQNPLFFQGTILENLKLDNNVLTQEEIIKACKIAQIHDFIMTLPKQYLTVLEENTSNLSGGQKQRLAIARALLKNTPILLLDEATSALDNKTQEKIQKGLQKTTKNKIVITIAHRLSTIIHIVGTGTH